MTPEAHDAGSGLPRSCTSLPINLLGLAALVATLFALRRAPGVDAATANLLVMAAWALPIAVLELVFLRTWSRPSTGLQLARPRPICWGRAAVKLLGFYASLGLVFGLYWLFPEYAFGEPGFYAPYWEALARVLPWVAVGAVPYVVLVDRAMREPRDGNWQLGALLLGRFAEVEREVLVQHLLGWLVKGFFLALMFSYLALDVAFFRNVDLARAFDDRAALYDLLWRSLFLIDVILAATGYVFTLRIFDSHIRTVEGTLLGWLSCVLCYQPFWTFVYRQYLTYDGSGMVWGVWLAESPVLYTVWGSAILALVAIYVLSTVPFGLRFSNLTHRGIVTNGPYRFCKHPAYVSKNLSWWLISVPFITSGGVLEALRHSLLLLLLNVVYFVRARTEERHLSRDPVYVAYALAMNRRSIFRALAAPLPFLRYRPAPHAPAPEPARA